MCGTVPGDCGPCRAWCGCCGGAGRRAVRALSGRGGAVPARRVPRHRRRAVLHPAGGTSAAGAACAAGRRPAGRRQASSARPGQGGRRAAVGGRHGAAGRLSGLSRRRRWGAAQQGDFAGVPVAGAPQAVGSLLRLRVEQAGAARGCGDVRPDLVSPAWCARLARCAGPAARHQRRDRGLRAARRPAGCSTCWSWSRPRADAVAARWRMGAQSTTAVVGESYDGPFGIDLRTDGPHGLIAGTTGSGKSELLQTIVASLAVANTPREHDVRPRRLQGRLGVQGLRAPAAHRRHGHRPGRPSGRAGPGVARRRAQAPRAHPGRGRRQGHRGLPGPGAPRPLARARAAAAHRHRRVRLHGPRPAGLRHRAWSTSRSAAGRSASTCCWPPSGPAASSPPRSGPTPTCGSRCG